MPFFESLVVAPYGVHAGINLLTRSNHPTQLLDDLAASSGWAAPLLGTVSFAFLSTTVQCARCHDHKFDPIPTKDYYALAGIFIPLAMERFGRDPAVGSSVSAATSRRVTLRSCSRRSRR